MIFSLLLAFQDRLSFRSLRFGAAAASCLALPLVISDASGNELGQDEGVGLVTERPRRASQSDRSKHV